jgi:ParB family chromosome partitioning protein
LMHPPTVRWDDGEAVLVSGRHRLEALRKRMETEVDCFVVELDDLRAELAEIDENLMRAELSPAQEAAQIKRRKQIYEALHPQTKQGGAPGAAGGGKKAKMADAATFAKATAEATGQSERTVRKKAAIAKNIEPDLLAKVEGTALDTTGNLEALAKKSPEEQRKLVEEAAEGKAVDVKETRPPKPPKQSKMEKIVGLFHDLSVEEQFQFATWVVETMKRGRVIGK